MQYMNVLIVTAHPASHGFTHKIAARYKKEKEDRGDEVFLMDLYKKKYQQPFLTFENPKTDCKPTATHRAIQEKITWADEIVLVFPVWWFAEPAILKNFFDQNFTAGFAYKYTPNGIRRELLEGRTARIFATADGPWWVYLIFHIIISLRFRVGVLGFCGIQVQSLDVFSDMIKKRDDLSRERMLERVAHRAHQFLPHTKIRRGVRTVK